MSASKKKQLRKENASSDTLSRAQLEQAAYKKKVRTYTVIGVVVAVLVAALLIWNSGIFQKNATAATVGEDKLSVGELGYYYYNARYPYAAYGLIDTSKEDSQQMYDSEKGITFRDYLLETALANAKSEFSLYYEALKAGHTDADVAESVAAQVAEAKLTAAKNSMSYKSLLTSTYGPYMTPAIFERVATRAALADLYYNEVGNEKLDSFTADDLEAYYQEHADEVDTFTYSYLYFKSDSVPTTADDGSELSEEDANKLKQSALEAARKKAEAALEEYESGKDFADIVESASPSSSGDHTEVQGVSALNAAFRDEMLKMNAGDSAVISYETYGCYVVIFHGRARSEAPSADVRHILFRVDAQTDEDGKVTAAPTDEAWNAAKEKAESALSEFKSGEQTPEAFGALAEKYSDDAGSNTKGGLYEGVTDGDFVTELNDWLFGEEQRKAGDTAVIRHEGSVDSSSSYWGYHVIYFQDQGEAEWQLSVRDTLTEDAMNEWTEDLAKGFEAKLDGGAKYIAK
ncbi:MAG: peptidylprolyl isomerase [Oscillospiraceae bacterium]|nr:peptidylprolyl isomerase [Oscillospiraceae bacterium]